MANQLRRLERLESANIVAAGYLVKWIGEPVSANVNGEWIRRSAEESAEVFMRRTQDQLAGKDFGWINVGGTAQ